MKIILCHSYKGGSGKTLFSINVANALTTNFDKKVLLIESDFSMAAFKSIFTEFKPDMFLNDFLNSQEDDLDKYIYPDTQAKLGIIFCDFKFRARDKVHGSDQNWFIQMKQQINRALEKLDYDYVIFDITPGMHFFAINIISITQEIFLMARPDVQNLHGIGVLLDKIYSKTIQLSSQKINLRIIFNQIPIIGKIDRLLSEWSNQLKVQYQFLENIHHFYYEPETSYNTAIEKFVLPKNDPTFARIKEFVKDNLI